MSGKVTEQNGDVWLSLDSGVKSLTGQILLWLYDLKKVDNGSTSPSGDERSEQRPIVILISGNDEYADLCESLMERR